MKQNEPHGSLVVYPNFDFFLLLGKSVLRGKQDFMASW